MVKSIRIFYPPKKEIFVTWAKSPIALRTEATTIGFSSVLFSLGIKT